MIIADDDNIIIWYSQILFMPNGDLGFKVQEYRMF